MNYGSPLLYSSNEQQPNPRKRPNKVHVSAACVNCKKAHLACDVSRPCQRCIATDKADTCHDIQHKKRGRPKMLRDSNNNKIRPVPTTTTPTNYRVISFPSVSAPNNDIMTILLSMDLCCARVTDESLEYLQLYPQEFSHRSIYDFLVPGESQQSIAKLHRCLLDNAVQHQQQKLPPAIIRSSFEQFFSVPLDTLLTIANGSLTLKAKLKFRCGHNKKEEEMNCKLYLGGGLGADLFDSDTLRQLYIVCILSPTTIRKDNVTTSVNNSTSAVTMETPMAATEAPATVTLTSTPVALTTTPTAVSLTTTPMFNLPPLILNVSSSTSPTTTNYSYTEGEDEEEENHGGEYFNDVDDGMEVNLISDSLLSDSATAVIEDSKLLKQEESETTTTPTTPQQQQQQQQPQASLLDKFRYNTNRPNKFIHPNELYYLNTTSSRLSSEAIAHTSFPYLSTKITTNNSTGSSSLAAYNNSLNK